MRRAQTAHTRSLRFSDNEVLSFCYPLYGYFHKRLEVFDGRRISYLSPVA